MDRDVGVRAVLKGKRKHDTWVCLEPVERDAFFHFAASETANAQNVHMLL